MKLVRRIAGAARLLATGKLAQSTGKRAVPRDGAQQRETVERAVSSTEFLEQIGVYGHVASDRPGEADERG